MSSVLSSFPDFFQAYMMDPLIPRLSEVFGPEPQIGLGVPAFMIVSGISILFYRRISGRVE
ncbi:hypothetical protein [uncultured Imperialibacter sp.]|uniref:hypothetical protein n=1 Tax=Imperialibacter sp. TaxID=2038411 RepID=UPI0030D749F9|tara:strand:+ start:1108 stop:1290 length:183 start_codon:yes stop_codon:yes gene_type:complete